jgi:hypothetical protein
MGIVLARSTGLQILTRRSRILLIAIVIATVGFVAPASDANTLFASQIGTLAVSPAHTDLDSTITVTVFDPDLNVTVLREFETKDSTGNLYELPIGNAGDGTIYKVQNSSIGDFNADGTVTSADVQLSTDKGSVLWVNKDSGTFQVIHTQAVALAENFTVTYRSEHNDLTSVTLRTPSDPAGFTLSLRETTSVSHTFTATFKTGAATDVTGAADATLVTRPVIKVADGDSITLEYADANPAKLISEAVVVDATKPVVSITSPVHLSSTSNATAWARAVVTDAAAGVELGDIKFHIDVDRDDVFDEPGEIVSASVADSVAINQGWSAAVLLPAISPDGLVNWYVTATDRASNVGQSDSEATDGDQFHKFTVDTAPPGLVEVVLGEAYDATAEKTIANVLNSVKVKWSEPIKESSIEVARFIYGNEMAKTAAMATDVTDTVWLTFEDIPTSPERLTILPGAVADLTDFTSELKEIVPIDKLGPRLIVSTDTAITNGLLTINVKTVETLKDDPTVTINGVTFGSAQPVDTNEWTIDVDGTTFTGAAAGDGVKNVEAAGFDEALNIARGGVAVETTGYPAGAVQFHLDSVIKPPVIVPGDREISLVPRPLITVSFADEIGEYSGDTHAGVTIISAKLDGIDVTSRFTAESASTWSYRPDDLENKQHTLEVVGRDDAGNTHGAIVRTFSVDAPAPTPTPVPTATSVPTATAIPAPTAVVTPTVEGAPVEVPNDATAVATASPDATTVPSVDETTPVPAEPEPTAEVTPTPETPEETVVPEPKAAPEDTPVDPEAAPTPAADEETAPAAEEEVVADDESGEPAAEEEVVTEDDIAATVAAMRAEDELEAETDGEQGDSIAPEPALTVFGCNVPTGEEEAVGAVVAGADYLIAVAGLFGLIVARVRPKRRKRIVSNSIVGRLR